MVCLSNHNQNRKVYKQGDIMCFSASASFITSGILLAIAIACLHATRTKSLKFFACIPLFFAIQQASEGIVWFGLNNQYDMLSSLGTSIYLFFAYFFWPVWIPLSMFLIENFLSRKKILFLLIMVGICFDIAVLLLGCCSAGAEIVGSHLQYTIPGLEPYSIVLTTLYCIATILPFFVASHYLFWIFGTSLAVALAGSYWYYYTYVTSIWCFFAALLSMLVLLIVYLYPDNQ